jgi:uncharacterized flavoprotein (TIGR03862 family)
MQIAIIGGGPAGLRAAEVAAGTGKSVTIFDAMPSVGRKFLVAGRGGLNLTHGEGRDAFAARYSMDEGQAVSWPRLLQEFSPEDLRSWAADLGIRTFQATSGRIYPQEMKAAPLLRRWVQRLRDLGVRFEMNHRLEKIRGADNRVLLSIASPNGNDEVVASAVVLACGGASWPKTGSNGDWVSVVAEHGVEVAPLMPSNVGWEVAWPPGLLEAAEGAPLKNLRVSAGGHAVHGELMVTRYGLEGGAIYQLGRFLRAMPSPEIVVDFKPTFSEADLMRKLGTQKPLSPVEMCARWKLSAAATAIVLWNISGSEKSAELLTQVVKACRLILQRPRPIAEAISSAGGVRWSSLDASLMFCRMPGIFAAGEMIDWDAPTGGYLMQGCFATGTLAGKSAAAWCERFP